MRKQKFLRKQKLFTKSHMVTYIVFLAGVSVTLLMVMFFENYTLQSPIILRSPVKSRFISPIGKIKATEMVRRDTIEDFTVSPTPTIAPRPTVMPKKAPVKRSLVPVAYAAESVDFDEVFEKQRILESGKGTAPVGHHKTCESKGLWNEIGYGNRQGLCFDTIEEGRLTLEKWYQKRFAEGMTLSEALCYWEGQGKNTNSCEYSQKYFGL